MKKNIRIIILLIFVIGILPSCQKENIEADTSEIVIPNAFTPNGDSLNDIFIVSGNNIRNYEIKIYDQNNLLLYNSKKIHDGWDGTYNSKPMPSGTYTYLIEYENEAGVKKQKKGSVELIR